MSKLKGFVTQRNPNKDAWRWFELIRAGKHKAAAALLEKERLRTRKATREAIDAQLAEIARSRG